MKLTRQSLLVPALLAALSFAAYACSPDSPSLVCGPGTVAKNGVCLPTPEDASVVDSGPTEETPDAAADAPAVDGGVVDAGEAPDPVSPPGTVHALFTNATNRFFTRDGRTLVVAGTKDGAQGVWRYDTRTQSVKKLADNATRVLALSADESFLLANAPDGIIRAKMDGSSSDLVYPRQAVDATPSADGKSVYYATTQQVRRVPLVRDGSDGETLYSLTKPTETFEGMMPNEATTHALVRVADTAAGRVHSSLQLVPGATLRRFASPSFLLLPPAPRVAAWGDFFLTPDVRANIVNADAVSTRIESYNALRGDFVYGLNPSSGTIPRKVCRSNMRTLDPVQCFDGTSGSERFVAAPLGRYGLYTVSNDLYRIDAETGATQKVAIFFGQISNLRISASGSHVAFCSTLSGPTSCFLYRFEAGAFARSALTEFTTVTGNESRIVYGNSSAKFDGTDVVQLADVAPNSVETFPSQASEVLFLSDSSKTLRIVEP